MHPTVRRIRAWAWGLVALGLILTAVLLTLLRLTLPFLGEYRAELEERVEAYLDMPVTIGRLDVEWHGLGPRLRLIDLRIEGPPGGGVLRFRDAYLDVGLAPQAQGLPFRIRGVSLVGAEVEADIDREGRVSLLGYTLDPAELHPPGVEPLPPEVADMVERLAGVGRLALLDASLVLHGPEGGRTEIADIDVRLRNEGPRHQVAASVSLPPELGERLRVVLDLSGPAGALRDWDGRVYAAGRGLALEAWSALWPRAPVAAAGGRLDVSAWGDWRAGRVQDVVADARVTGLALRARDDGASAGLAEAEGRFAWQRDGDDGWTLDAGGFQLERDGRAWPQSGFSIARDAGGWRLAADFLRLGDVAALAEVLPAPPERLAAMAPRGTLRDLRAAGTGPGDFALRGAFDDLGWSAHGRIPGVTGLDGHARVDADGGTIELSTADAGVDAPWLFRERLPLARLEGTLHVEREADRWTARAARVVAANADVHAVGRVHVAAGGDAPPWLDLQADFRDGDVASAPRYLPAGVMPDEVVSWLDAALDGGRVVDGTMLLRGPADAFPYRGREGVFDVDFRVAGARLDYAPGWPALEALDGRVRFHGAGLTITGDAARVRDTRVASLQARFEDLEQGRLRIRAETDGPFADLVRVVEASPLEGGAGAFLEGARAGGPARLDLALDIPLREIEDTAVQGRLQLAGSRLEQPRFDLVLDGLDGEVAFTRESLSIDGLAARLRGRPVTIDARTSGGEIHVTAAGRLALSDVLRDAPAVLTRHADGRADWRIHARVPAADADTMTLSGESDLAGTAITLPPPLAKDAAASRRLRFELTLEGETMRGTLAYGDTVTAALAVARVGDRLALDRATLRFGDGTARLHPGPGVHVEGRLDALDLGPWRALRADAAGDSDADTPALAGVDLEVARLAFGGRVLSEARVHAERTDAGWRLDLASDELSGRVTAPTPLRPEGRPATVRLEWVDLERLRAPADGDAPGAGGADPEPQDPATLPPLDVRIERLRTADGLLRDLVLVTAPLRDGLAVHRLQLGTEGLALEGQGQWLGGDPQRTSLRLTLQAEDLGTGLGALGYGEAFRDGRGQITVDIGWAGPPWAPDAASLEGHARIDLRDGAINEVDPGPARILGLFSLNVLRLDFQGLLRRGFPFDRLRGRIDFADGNAYTNGLTVEGPAGRLRVSGRTGLVAQDYDQTVVYRPALSQSLPLIGALSGGPATGVAVALIQGLLRNLGADVEHATELRYSLTGSWAEPRVERVTTESADNDARQRAPGGTTGR